MTRPLREGIDLMFAAFLQGFLGKLIALGAIIAGVAMCAHDAPGAGITVILLGVFLGAFLRYLSRQTVRVRS